MILHAQLAIWFSYSLVTQLSLYRSLDAFVCVVQTRKSARIANRDHAQSPVPLAKYISKPYSTLELCEYMVCFTIEDLRLKKN